jgi:tetratricopeptide (TPR) repeat protein
LYEEGLAAGRGGDYARAAELLTLLVGRSDRFPQALLYLGRSRHALGQHAQAVQAFSFFLRGRPESAAGHFFLGRSYLALDDVPGAVRALRRALEYSPRMAPAWGLLGLALARARRFARAVEAFRTALDIDPDNPRLLTGYLNASLVHAIRLFYQGQLIDSAGVFQEVLRFRDSSILPHLYLASIYRELGRENLAGFHMDAATRLSPDDPFLRLQKALVLLAQGQAAAAREEIRLASGLLQSAAAPAVDPREVLRFLAINLFRQKRYREAVFFASKLLRQAYDDAGLHALVAESYHTMGELEKARNHYRRALAADRDAAELRHGLLAVLWQMGDYRELAEECARLLRRDPRDEVGCYFNSLALSRTGAPATEVLEALQGQIKARGPDRALMAELGAAYARAGLPELAEGWLQRALTIEADDPATLQVLADVYRALSREADETAAIRRYLAARPADGAARRRLLRLLLAHAAFAEASQEVSRLLSAEPDSIRLRSLLALCHRRSGRYADALLLFRDLLAAEPGNEDYAKGAVYCLDRLGSRSTASAFLDAFMKKHGESLSLVLILGVLQFQDREMEKAAATFRRAVSSWPRSWRAHRNLGMVYRKTGNPAFAEKFLARAAELKKDERARERPRPAHRAGG